MGDLVLVVRAQGSQTPALQWVTPSLANGQVGASYSQLLEGTGGIRPHVFAVAPGSSVAPGLSVALINGAWYVTGTPILSGSYTSILQLTDSGGALPVLKAFPYTVAPAQTQLQIATTGFPTGTVGVPYDQPVVITGGTPPYGLTKPSGSFPSGIVIVVVGPTNIRLQGTPTTVESAVFTLEATDAAAGVAPGGPFTLTITATPQLQITTTSLPAATQGTAWGPYEIQAINGTPPYVFNISNKPAWMSYGSSGGHTNNLVSGTPDSDDDLALATTVTDTATVTAGQSIAVVVFPVGQGETRDAYYIQLRDDPNNVQSIAFTTQAEIDAVTRSGWRPNVVTHIPNAPGNPASWESMHASIVASYPTPPGDYATIVKPPRREFSSTPFIVNHPIYATFATPDQGDEGLDNKMVMWCPITRATNNPGFTDGAVFVVTFDVYWSKSLYDNRGPIPGGSNFVNAWKGAWIMAGSATTREATNVYTLQHTPYANAGEVAQGIFAKTKEGPIGTTHAVPPTPPGFAGEWQQYYTPTGSPTYPNYQTFPLLFDMWTRYWYFYRLSVNADDPTEFTEWKTQIAGGSALTGVWDMVSIAMADEITGPRWEYYRVPTRREAALPYVKTVCPVKMDGSTNNKKNILDGMSGPLFIKVRYLNVLQGARDNTLEMRKPVR